MVCRVFCGIDTLFLFLNRQSGIARAVKTKETRAVRALSDIKKTRVQICPRGAETDEKNGKKSWIPLRFAVRILAFFL